MKKRYGHESSSSSLSTFDDKLSGFLNEKYDESSNCQAILWVCYASGGYRSASMVIASDSGTSAQCR